MADAVNGIQDTFSIQDPAAGDLLVYSTESSKFENKSQFESIGEIAKVAQINWTFNSGVFSPDQVQDPNNLISVDGAYWTLLAGTYLFLAAGYTAYNPALGNTLNISWNSETAGVIKNMESQVTGVIGNERFLTPNYNFSRTIASTETFRWTGTSPSLTAGFVIPGLIVIKLR
jgi:hypothetical protein